MKRNINIDFLKVISSFAVVGIHVFSFNYNLPIITYFHSFFYFAVPCFFMINGFFVLNKEDITYKYCFKKILAILSIVFLWNFIFSVLYLVLKHNFLNPVMMTFQCLFFQKGIFQHLWFFGAMIINLLLAPIIHKIISHKNGYCFCISTMFCCCMIIYLGSLIIHKHINNFFPQTFRVWTWLFYFVIGGYFGKHKQYLNKINIKIYFLITIILMLTFPLYHVYARENINYDSPYIDPYGIVTNINLFIFINRIKFDINSKFTNLIIQFSTLSMGCYIIHCPIRDVIYQYLGYTYPWLTIIIWVILILISYTLALLINKIKFINRLIKL